nr:uncharacterized protein LOC129387727 [Dermacentor andersoni]
MCEQRWLRPSFHHFPRFSLLQSPAVERYVFFGSCRRIARALNKNVQDCEILAALTTSRRIPPSQEIASSFGGDVKPIAYDEHGGCDEGALDVHLQVQWEYDAESVGGRENLLQEPTPVLGDLAYDDAIRAEHLQVEIKREKLKEHPYTCNLAV